MSEHNNSEDLKDKIKCKKMCSKLMTGSGEGTFVLFNPHLMHAMAHSATRLLHTVTQALHTDILSATKHFGSFETSMTY
jgi:hypothetical protein